MNAKPREEKNYYFKIFDAARHMTTLMFYIKLHVPVKRGRMCIQADYGYFKHLLNQTAHYLL
jgi:nitrate reductase assembly molybdenum cofactor insertion protein NarJ